MIGIWVILGLLIGALAETIWKAPRPLGAAWDYAIAIVLCIGTGLIDWYVLPLLNIEGTIKFLAAVIEPPLMALIGLWAVRKFKKA
jgi:hypothetical protein